MSDARAITVSHRERLAVAYLRQSSPAQVRQNTESTARQYALAEEAAQLGWDAATTSARDRKRVVRALIADVTLQSAPGSKVVRVGVRWQSGASEELVVHRPAPAPVLRRSPTQPWNWSGP